MHLLSCEKSILTSLSLTLYTNAASYRYVCKANVNLLLILFSTRIFSTVYCTIGFCWVYTRKRNLSPQQDQREKVKQRQ